MCQGMSRFSSLLSQKGWVCFEMSRMSRMSLYSFLWKVMCFFCLVCCVVCVSRNKSKEKPWHPWHLANPPSFLRKNDSNPWHTLTSSLKSLLFSKGGRREVFQFLRYEGFHLNSSLLRSFAKRTILILDIPLYLFSPLFSFPYLSSATFNGPKTVAERSLCLRSRKPPLRLPTVLKRTVLQEWDWIGPKAWIWFGNKARFRTEKRSCELTENE